MTPADTVTVTGEGGLTGTIDTTTSSLDQDERVLVQIENGPQIWVPTEIFELREDGSYYIPVDLSQMTMSYDADSTVVVLPVIVEELKVGKRKVETGRVRISKTVSEREELVDEAGTVEEIEVIRVPLQQVLKEPAKVRYEGDTMIIPVMEEVLVVEKRLVLTEEVYVTRRRREIRDPQRHILRSEAVTVERIDPDREAPE